MIKKVIVPRFDPVKLLGELTAIPSLQPRARENGMIEAVVRISGANLEMPDDADVTAVDAVIAAHDPKPLPAPVPGKRIRTLLARIETDLPDATTVNKLLAVVVKQHRVIKALARVAIERDFDPDTN